LDPDSSRWIEERKLMLADGDLSDYFGWSVSVSGDVVLAGAPGNDDNGSASGSAHLFDLNVLCAGDIDGDGMIGILDLLAMFSTWGACPGPQLPCPADLDGDGSVGGADLSILFANWS
jgi:FG-GAP repeat protein/dockerin type I repeat protein